MGHPVNIMTADGQVAGTVTVSQPVVSRSTRVTNSGGVTTTSTPQNGYFVIATVSISMSPSYRPTSSSDSFISVGPGEFYALVNGSYYQGGDNEDNSSAADAIDPQTQNALNIDAVDPGKNKTGLVPFDVSAPHGEILFFPAWPFTYAERNDPPTNNPADWTPLARWTF